MRGLAIPRAVVLVGIFLLVSPLACGKPDPPVTPTEIDKQPPDPDVPAPLKPATGTTTDASACVKLRELGCVEGSPARGKCEDTFKNARTNSRPEDRGKVEGVSACVTKSATVVDVRACGGRNTLTFDCPGK